MRDEAAAEPFDERHFCALDRKPHIHLAYVAPTREKTVRLAVVNITLGRLGKGAKTLLSRLIHPNKPQAQRHLALVVDNRHRPPGIEPVPPCSFSTTRL
jgi:hypothetical protein